MKNAMWRGRLMMLCLGCMTLMTAGGCSGLSDRQLSQILQSTVTTGMSTLLSTVLSAAFGTTG